MTAGSITYEQSIHQRKHSSLTEIRGNTGRNERADAQCVALADFQRGTTPPHPNRACAAAGIVTARRGARGATPAHAGRCPGHRAHRSGRPLKMSGICPGNYPLCHRNGCSPPFIARTAPRRSGQHSSFGNSANASASVPQSYRPLCFHLGRLQDGFGCVPPIRHSEWRLKLQSRTRCAAARRRRDGSLHRCPYMRAAFAHRARDSAR